MNHDTKSFDKINALVYQDYKLLGILTYNENMKNVQINRF